MSVAIVIILDTRRIKGNNKYPVKLRVNFKRVTNYYQTTFDLTEQEYKKLSATRISEDLQNIKSKLKEIERQAESEIKGIVPFNFIDFEEKYISNNPFFRERKIKKKLIPEFFDDFDYSPFLRRFSILSEKDIAPGTIAWSYKEYIKRLLKEGRIGTAVNYKCSYVSLKKFQGNVCFSAITTHFLTAYENKLKSEGVSKSTIGLYLRPLRAVFNEAIEEGLARKDKSYPFGKRKYQIPTSRNIKKALELDDVKQIYYYDTNLLTETEQRSRDYWLFSYFGNGMNAKDVACLKFQNIHDDYIIFERAKTERLQRSNPKPIIVYLNEDMKNIIQRWGNKQTSPNDYVFPILQQGITPFRQYILIENFVSLINKCMKKILQDLGINKKATTYVARHTFSTVLKRSGASIEQIQEALGHADIKTTENYLDSFDKETKKQLASSLTSFKKKETVMLEE